MEYVYVLEFPDCVKIGYSTRIDSRIKQVESTVGHKATNAYYRVATRDTETAMHGFFKSRRISGEFFAIPFNEAKKALRDMVRNPDRYKLPKKRQYTEAQRKAAVKWEEKSYDRMSIGMLRGSDVDKSAIHAAAAAAGMSANAYILQAVREKMSRDAGEKSGSPG